MRICMFCDARATTAEHIWPEWVVTALGKRATVEMWFGDEKRTWRVGKNKRSQARVKYLCQPCNNNWMSGLESAAIPIIRPFMNDLSIRLDDEAQRLITAWAVKMTMVFESTAPGRDWFYSKAEREHL